MIFSSMESGSKLPNILNGLVCGLVVLCLRRVGVVINGWIPVFIRLDRVNEPGSSTSGEGVHACKPDTVPMAEKRYIRKKSPTPKLIEILKSIVDLNIASQQLDVHIEQSTRCADRYLSIKCLLGNLSLGFSDVRTYCKKACGRLRIL